MVVLLDHLNDFVPEPVFAVPNVVFLDQGEQVGSISLHLIDSSLNQIGRQIVGLASKSLKLLLRVKVEHPAVLL